MILLLLIIIWHLDHDIVLDYFKDCNFWMMDIFIYYLIVIALCGMKTFPLNFPVGGVFLLANIFRRFLGEKPGGLHKILVCGGSPHGEIGYGEIEACLFP